MCSGFGSVVGSVTGNNQRNLTANVVAERDAYLGRGSAQNLLVQFGQLARQRQVALRQHFGDERQRLLSAIRGLEGDCRPWIIDEGRQQSTGLTRFSWNVTEERETRAAVARDR